MESDETQNSNRGHKRSVTSLTLGWLAERLKRAERLKKEIAAGSYRVDSSAVAQAMISPKNDPN